MTELKPDRTLTAEEAADKLRIHIDTLYPLAKQRKVPHFRIGRRVFFSERALDEWIVLQVQNSMIPVPVEGTPRLRKV